MPDSSENCNSSIEQRSRDIVAAMTLEEKVGQMCQVNGGTPGLHDAVRAGRVGAILNEVDTDEVNRLQRLAIEESRLGIPLLVGRDVIHGFKTLFPIPLAQACSWDPALLELGARVAAREAAAAGINWTFAPMIDITRDPRWGRIAESLGEDPYLCGTLGAAMVRGFQGERLDNGDSLAACAKHFAGYGAVEAGLDYNTANIPEVELRNVYLPPFRRALEAGAATVMASFNELNGVPGAANRLLLQQVLRHEWGFDGAVVSDWNSVSELIVHGFSATERDAVEAAVGAGVDMEMAGTLYWDHIAALVGEGLISEARIDEQVGNILRLKLRLGLFDNPRLDPLPLEKSVKAEHLDAARAAALRSCVLLKNDERALPLRREALSSLAIIGALADDGHEQMGTWAFDGEAEDCRTCLAAIRSLLCEEVELRFCPGYESTRSRSQAGFEAAVQTARASDAVVMFVGEESILSGEAHCRADISLPGAQEALIDAVAATGKPLILVVMAGRPLTLERVIDRVDAILYAWHPGTMGGPAIADLLLGLASPSGKLPVSFPRMVGQVPIYYARKNTGRPAAPDDVIPVEDIPARAVQTSLGMTAFHLDAGYTPQYPFGYGLSYSRFRYSDIDIASPRVAPGDVIEISATLSNIGDVVAEEVAQLYVRDLVGSLTRPVRELKGFRRVRLEPGQSERIRFRLHTDELAFCNGEMRWVVEAGEFHAWIGGDANADLRTEFAVVTRA